jgi:uncharacterized protein YhfF
MMNDEIKMYWHRYLETLPADSPIRQEVCEAGAFGDNSELANKLASLVVSGVKTATCSALWEWEAEEEPLPKTGEKFILLDGQGESVCVLETTEVFIKPYNEVDAGFASEEGEGDRSLEYWREAHWKFFSRTLPKIGKEPKEDMPLICERFKVVYGEN